MNFAIVSALVGLWLMLRHSRTAATSFAAILVAGVMVACDSGSDKESARGRVNIDFSGYAPIVVLPREKDSLGQMYTWLKRNQAREIVEEQKRSHEASILQLKEKLARIKAKWDDVQAKRLRDSAAAANAARVNAFWAQLRAFEAAKYAEHRKSFSESVAAYYEFGC